MKFFDCSDPQCCCSEKVEDSKMKAPSKVFGSADLGVYDYLDVAVNPQSTQTKVAKTGT